MTMKGVAVGVVLLFLSTAVLADVWPAEIFDSHMVLQRDANVPIWGKAEPGEKVSVSFKRQSVSTVADAEGNWEVCLAPEPYGGPFVLVLQGNNKIELTDILVGDVWIFGGQSNAPWGTGTPELLPLAQEIMAKTTTVRHGKLAVLSKTCEYPDAVMNGRVVWSTGDPKRSFALPVFFLYPINLATGIPQGYLLTAMAGTAIEPWIPVQGYHAVAGLDDVKAKLKILEPGTTEYKTHSEKQFNYVRQWLQQAKLNDKEGLPVPALEIPPRVHRTLQHQYPTCLYNGCFAPLAPMAIKGVFWYQGESNVGDGDYRKKLEAFAAGCRINFRSPAASFFIVQPCPCETYGNDNARLAELWERQLAFADADGKSYVAATGDIGDVKDLHPGGRSKEKIARRLSNLALKYLYGQQDVKADFPRYQSSSATGDQMVVTFKHANGLHSADGEPIRHFEVAGADGRYFPARAMIAGTTIVLTSEKVSRPVNARYGWSNVAVPNLYNENDLPVFSFRTSKD